MTQHSVSLPPYMSASTAPAMEVDLLSSPTLERSAKGNVRRRSVRRAGQRNVVNLLLNEVSLSETQAWPDEAPLLPARRLRKKDFSQNVAVRTLKLGVGASLLAVIGFQSLIKGWNQSEIWVKNAVKTLVFSLVFLYLLGSTVVLALGMLTVHQEAPVVQGLYQAHRVKNASLKSEIKRIQSGEDAEALARGYLDMVKPGEALLKIHRP